MTNYLVYRKFNSYIIRQDILMSRIISDAIAYVIALLHLIFSPKLFLSKNETKYVSHARDIQCQRISFH